MKALLRSIQLLGCLSLLPFLTASVAIGQAGSEPELIAYWAFNSPGVNPEAWPPPIVADEGAGTLTHSFITQSGNGHSSFSGSTINAQPGYSEGGSFAPQGNFNNGNGFTLVLSTAGYEDIEISYATQRTATGFDAQTFEYSVDSGISFVPVDVVTDIPTSFALRQVSLPLEAANHAELHVRVTVTGATAASGNNRFDNLLITGTPSSTDPPTPTIQFGLAGGEVNESVETYEIEVQLSNAGEEAVSVDVVFDAGSSTASSADVGGFTSTTVTLSAADPTETVTVTIVDNEEEEGDRSAVFELQNLVGDAELGSPSTFTLTILDDDAPPLLLVINEIHAEPDGEEGNANNDGSVGGVADEFVEIVNIGDDIVNLTDYTISDAVGIRHTFPAGTVLAPNQAIVIFGGGDPQGNFGGALVQVAPTGNGLGLNNDGDTVTLRDVQGNVVAEEGYGGAGNNEQSLTLSPDLTGESLVLHSQAVGSGGALFSPGTMVDGTPFGGGNPDAIATVIKGGSGWRFLAPPSSTMSVADLVDQNLVQGLPDEYPEGAPNLYVGFDGSGFVAPEGEATPLEPGRGFLWFFYDVAYDPQDAGFVGESESFPLPFTLQSTGAVPEADVLVDLHANGEGWNLLGNPFSQAINLDQLEVSEGESLVSVVGQVWDPEGRGYRLTTAVAHPEAPNVLAIWQGAFFQNADAESVTIPVAAKLGSGSEFYGRPGVAAEVRRIGFDLTGEASRDRAIALYFSEGGSEAWDLWDATKLTPLTGTYATLAFVGERDGAEVLKAQESRSLEPGSFTVPMALETAGVSGTFTLRWPRWRNVPETWMLELEDLVTGATVDLRAADSLAFAAEATRPSSASEEPVIRSQERSAEARFLLHVTTPTVSEEEAAAGPETFALEAVYPNPMTEKATLAYTLPEAADVRLVVYDVLGREVAVIADTHREAGRYRADWDATGLASGIYVLRLKAGAHTATVKAVVAR